VRHSLHIEGSTFRLRPLTEQDAEFVIELRTDPELSRYLHPISRHVADQIIWARKYFETPGDYCFVVERIRDSRAEGLISLYHVEPTIRTGECGRWVLRRGSLAGVESCWLLYKIGFEHIGLESIYCLTLAENGRTISFHDSCGLSRTSMLKGYVKMKGRCYDAVKHELSRAAWPSVSMRMEKIVSRMARMAHV